MPVTMNVSYAQRPTASEKGILGVRVTCDGAIVKPISIGLTVDTSGSMEGERLDAVKKTIGVLIERLRSGDSISVSGFSHKGTVILSGHVITDSNRADAVALINALVAGGGTNFEAGISALGSVLQNGVAPFDAVVVLTDGHANEGIMSVAGLSSLCNSYMKDTPVYTIGYGEEHNSDLLSGLSRRTHGTYTFVDDETVLPAAMADLMTSLQDEVAKSASLAFPSSWTCLELGAVAGDTYEFGSLIANKPAVWAVFELPAGSEHVESLALTYKQFGVASDATAVGLVDGALDRLDVLEQFLRCNAVRALDAVSAALQRYDVQKAKDILTEAIAAINSSEGGGRPVAISMKARLEEMMEKASHVLQTPPPTRRRGHSPPAIRRVGALSPMALARTASSTASNYGTQRGVTSGGGHTHALFSSPRMLREQHATVQQYSTGGAPSPHDPAPHDNV